MHIASLECSEYLFSFWYSIWLPRLKIYRKPWNLSYLSQIAYIIALKYAPRDQWVFSVNSWKKSPRTPIIQANPLSICWKKYKDHQKFSKATMCQYWPESHHSRNFASLTRMQGTISCFKRSALEMLWGPVYPNQHRSSSFLGEWLQSQPLARQDDICWNWWQNNVADSAIHIVPLC